MFGITRTWKCEDGKRLKDFVTSRPRTFDQRTWRPKLAGERPPKTFWIFGGDVMAVLSRKGRNLSPKKQTHRDQSDRGETQTGDLHQSKKVVGGTSDLGTEEWSGIGAASGQPKRRSDRKVVWHGHSGLSVPALGFQPRDPTAGVSSNGNTISDSR